MTVRPICVVFAALFTLTAQAQTPPATTPPATTPPATPPAATTPAATTPATTPPAAAAPSVTAPAGTETASDAPKTSGSPEFDALLKQWDELRDKLEKLQVDYKTSKPEGREPLVAEFNKLRAEGETLQPQVLKAAEAGFKANPKGVAFSTFLVAYAMGLYGRGDYDEALRLADVLIAGGYENKRIYNLAGKAANNVCDFEKAEKYLTIARDATALDGRADGLLQNMAAYKPLWKKEQEIRAQEAKDAADPAKALPRVLLKTEKGDIVIELFENEAPQTVGNFISLVEKGFYNGLTFHRVIHEFMAQGGDPKGTGGGGPEYMVPCECYQENHRLHFRGSLSMAHAGKDTGGSQFFLTFVPTPQLDGTAVNPKNLGACHTVFGRVVEGMDVLAKITRREATDPHGFGGAAPPPRADKILEAKVLRKRSHPYEPTKVTPLTLATPDPTKADPAKSDPAKVDPAAKPVPPVTPATTP